MIGEGGLALDVAWDGKQITGASVCSTRPLRVSRVLEGKPAVQAIAMVPLLFSVCGRAQTVAAASALEAAAGCLPGDPARRQRELLVAAEGAQEHLWRFLLDLPALLGQAPRQERFMAMRRRFEAWRRGAVSPTAWWNEAGAGGDPGAWRGFAGDLAELLATEVLGLEPGRFLELDGWEKWAGWLESGRGFVAPLLRRLRDLPAGGGDLPLLALPEGAVLIGELGSAIEAADGFAAVPTRGGVPAETGALAREANQPPLAALLARGGRTVAVRLLARLLDLARLADRLRELAHGGAVQPWLRAAGLRPGTGVAAVETARGVLIHLVTLEGERVARWRIVAPTEWNFHPDGAFVRGLVGCPAQDEAGVKRAAALLAHALDPCVAFEVSVGHA